MFMATKENVTSEVFSFFLMSLIAGASNQMFFIVDNHTIHSSSESLGYKKSTHGKKRLFDLSPCSPAFNLNERV